MKIPEKWHAGIQFYGWIWLFIGFACFMAFLPDMISAFRRFISH